MEEDREQRGAVVWELLQKWLRYWARKNKK